MYAPRNPSPRKADWLVQGCTSRHLQTLRQAETLAGMLVIEVDGSDDEMEVEDHWHAAASPEAAAMGQSTVSLPVLGNEHSTCTLVIL